MISTAVTFMAGAICGVPRLHKAILALLALLFVPLEQKPVFAQSQPKATAGDRVVTTRAGAASLRAADRQRLLRALGARLFFDQALSADGTVSCATCHAPEKAFSDGRARALGLNGLAGIRNTPSLVNASQSRSLYWDGRRDSLEQQAADPFVHPQEHGLSSVSELTAVINANVSYQQEFGRIFGTRAASANQAYEALAEFERSLVANDSPFDRFAKTGEKAALTPSAQRGLALFAGRAGCANCHTLNGTTASFSDDNFHALGLQTAGVAEALADLIRRANVNRGEALNQKLIRDPELAPLGRYLVTWDLKDIGAFRTPSLRNVARTAPYMHDGSVQTLREAIDHEVNYRGRLDGQLLILTVDERNDLLAFMESLTSESLSELARQSHALATRNSATVALPKHRTK
jgi:cytochrome c peroxidase